MILSFNVMQTVGFAILVFLVGKFIRTKVKFFQTFCVPAPVIGGFLFAIIRFVLALTGLCTFVFDNTLKDPFMMVFFTSIGVGADLDTLKKGGKGFVYFLLVATFLVIRSEERRVGK